MPQSDTKERILDTAERLFAEKGYEACSLRLLTQEAGANLAAVNYHFRSKEGLLRAVFERRVGDINAERLQRLDSLESRGRERPPTVRELLEAFLAPAIEHLSARDEGCRRFIQLVGRMHTASGGHAALVRDVFREVEGRFVPALVGALPHLSREALQWRMHFVIGVLCNTIAEPDRLQVWSEGVCDAFDTRETIRRMVTFASAGMSAPEGGEDA